MADSNATAAKTSKFRLQSTDHTLETLPANSFLAHATNGFGIWGAGVALAIHDLFPNADKVYAAHCDSFRPTRDAWPRKQGLVGGVCVVPPQLGDHAATSIRDAEESEKSQVGGDKKGVGGAQKKDMMSDARPDGIWITCLFASYGFGRPTKKHAGLDRKGEIRAQTRSALIEFRQVVESIEVGNYHIDETGDMRKLDVSAAGVPEGLEAKILVGEKRKSHPEEEEAEDTGSVGKISKQLVENKSKARKMDIYSPQFNSGKFGMPWEETKKVVEQVFSDWEGNWYVLSPPT